MVVNNPRKAAAGGHPDGALRVLLEAVDQAARSLDQRERVVHQPRRLLAGADPHGARSILIQRANRRVQRLFRGDRRELLTRVAEDVSFVGPDPQIAFGVFEQRGDLGVFQRRRALSIERRERDAIEPHQACLGAEPQITVTPEHDRPHPVLRQAVLRLPHVMAILRQRLRPWPIDDRLRAARRHRRTHDECDDKDTTSRNREQTHLSRPAGSVANRRAYKPSGRVDTRQDRHLDRSPSISELQSARSSETPAQPIAC